MHILHKALFYAGFEHFEIEGTAKENEKQIICIYLGHFSKRNLGRVSFFVGEFDAKQLEKCFRQGGQYDRGKSK